MSEAEPSKQDINIPEIIEQNKLTLSIALKTIRDIANATQRHPDVTFLAAMIPCNTLNEMCHAKPPYRNQKITNDPEEFKQLIDAALAAIQLLRKNNLNQKQKNGLNDAGTKLKRTLAIAVANNKTKELPVLTRAETEKEISVADTIPTSICTQICEAAEAVTQILETEIFPSVTAQHQPTIVAYAAQFSSLANLALDATTKKSDLFSIVNGAKNSITTILQHFGTPRATQRLRELQTILENSHARMQ